ncbi:cadBA operon transcriptional activator [Escherichia coli]|nr:cadBA operon transcriptional activator [Escherichia coli]
MQEMPQQILPHRGALLTKFYQEHASLMHGDDKSVVRASKLIGENAQITLKFNKETGENEICIMMIAHFKPS